MTLQDLKENRERIIKNIKNQTFATNAVKEVMIKMVAWLESRKDIIEMKPTMKNIDKFTSMVTLSWIKYDYKSDFSNQKFREEFEKKREAAQRSSHSTFF